MVSCVAVINIVRAEPPVGKATARRGLLIKRRPFARLFETAFLMPATVMAPKRRRGTSAPMEMSKGVKGSFSQQSGWARALREGLVSIQLDRFSA